MMLVALVAAVSPSPAAATPRDATSVVRQLLDGWREGDTAKALSTLAPDFRLLTLRQDGAGKRLESDTLASVKKSMLQLKPGVWDVRPGVIKVSQDTTGIASVWVPYTFYLAGKKSHCGVEVYTLYRLDEGWKIVEFADTHLWNGSEAQCVDRPPAGQVSKNH